MKPLTDEKKAAFRTLQIRRSLLALAIAHPEKMNDETAVATVSALAGKVADARIALKEVGCARTSPSAA
jgi:hypothetical protein